MLIALILSGFMYSSFYQGQMKYEHCKEKQFKGKYCELQKRLSKLPKRAKK